MYAGVCSFFKSSMKTNTLTSRQLIELRIECELNTCGPFVLFTPDVWSCCPNFDSVTCLLALRTPIQTTALAIYQSRVVSSSVLSPIISTTRQLTSEYYGNVMLPMTKEKKSWKSKTYHFENYGNVIRPTEDLGLLDNFLSGQIFTHKTASFLLCSVL